MNGLHIPARPAFSSALSYAKCSCGPGGALIDPCAGIGRARAETLPRAVAICLDLYIVAWLIVGGAIAALLATVGGAVAQE